MSVTKPCGGQGNDIEMSNFKDSKMGAAGTIGIYCAECGKKIEGEPYEMSFSGVCASSEPVHFCSKNCWEASEEYNTDNWD